MKHRYVRDMEKKSSKNGKFHLKLRLREFCLDGTS